MAELVEALGDAIPHPGVRGQAVDEQQRPLIAAWPHVGVELDPAGRCDPARLHGDGPYRPASAYEEVAAARKRPISRSSSIESRGDRRRSALPRSNSPTRSPLPPEGAPPPLSG